MTEPDDRELEQYLKGNSPLSRRYREASGETAPPELDEAILAQARRAARPRPPGINRWLTPLALAASVLLGVNLGWNVYKAAPAPGEVPELQDAEPPPQSPPPMEKRAADAPAMVPRAARVERKAPAASPAPPASIDQATAAPETGSLARREADLEARGEAEAQQKSAEQEQEQARRQAAEPTRRRELQAQDAMTAPPPAAVVPVLSESEKIDRLIAFVSGLQGAVFIRNGDEHSATEAAKHLQMKREKAGDRVRAADDFIRLCASHSYLPGEAYLIRFADGRTRTAEDVLREELARINSAR